MITWAVQAAQKSGLFDHIIVSTDDKIIAQIALESGAEVPFMRPQEISDDYTPTRPVICHAVENIESLTSKKVAQICCIYATAAFITPQDLQEAYQKLADKNTLFAFSATSYSHPIQRAFYQLEDGDGGVKMRQEEYRTVRTQDLSEFYHDAGMFYFGKREGFFSDTPMFGKQSRIVKIPRNRSFDIDNQEDWDLAQAVFMGTRR